MHCFREIRWTESEHSELPLLFRIDCSNILRIFACFFIYTGNRSLYSSTNKNIPSLSLFQAKHTHTQKKYKVHEIEFQMRHTREFLGKNSYESRRFGTCISNPTQHSRSQTKKEHDYCTSGNTFAAELKMYNNKMLVTFSLFRFWWKLFCRKNGRRERVFMSKTELAT